MRVEKRTLSKVVSLALMVCLILCMAPTIQVAAVVDYSAFTNLLTNPSFEDSNGSMTGWSQDGSATGTTYAVVGDTNDGNYAVCISGRTKTYTTLAQDVTSAFNTNGSGDYYFEGWAKLAAGASASVARIQLQLTADGTTKYYNTDYFPGGFPEGYSAASATINGSGYTKIANVLPLSWTGTVTQARLLLITNDINADTNVLYIDNMSLKYISSVSPVVDNTYYFSTSGNDSNSGTIESPKKSLAAAEALMVPGNTILFKRGDAWYSPTEGWNLSDIAGTAQNPVIIGAYGNENDPKPIIAVMYLLDSGWTDEGSNIWSHALPSADIRRLFVDEASKASVSDLAGVDANHYFADLISNKVYIYSTTEPTYVEVIPRFETSGDPDIWTDTSRIIQATNISYFTFRDIEFRGGSNWSAIHIFAPSSNITFDSCTLQELTKYGIDFSENEGVTAAYHDSPVVKNCSITKTWSLAENSTTASNSGDGVFFSAAVEGGLVQGNTIFEMGHVGIKLFGNRPDYHGVNNCVVELNEVYTLVNNYCHGLDLAGMEGKCTGNIVRRNYLHDLTVTSHVMGDHNMFYSNIFVNHDKSPAKPSNPQAEAMDLMPWTDAFGNLVAHDNIIANNTIVDCEMSPIDIAGALVGQNNMIVNNAIVSWAKTANNDYAAVRISSVSNAVEVQNNGVWNSSSDTAASDPVFINGNVKKTAEAANNDWSSFSGNIQEEPLFVNAANRDFHLTIASPYRTAGQIISDLMGDGFVDYDGKPWDPKVPSIGAFQFIKQLNVDSVTQIPIVGSGSYAKDTTIDQTVPGYGPELAIDGDANTRWEGINDYGYVTYDFGISQSISSVGIYHGSNGQRVDILVSDDGENFTCVKSGEIPFVTSKPSVWTDFTLDTVVNVRYVRYVPNGFYNSPYYPFSTTLEVRMSDGSGNSIDLTALYNNGDLQVSDNRHQGAGDLPQNTVDGSTSTKWVTSARYAALLLDLGSVLPVESLDIDWYNLEQNSTYYHIFTSADGVTYKENYYGQTGLGSSSSNFSIAGEEIRYIQIVGRDNSDLDNYNKVSISEVRVNGFRDPIVPEDSFHISTSTFKDLSGNDVSSLTAGGTIVVNATVENVAYDPLQATFIIALYNSQGGLLNISFSQKMVSVHEQVTLGAGFNLPSDVTGCNIKVFVWDSISNQYPLSNVVELSSN